MCHGVVHQINNNNRLHLYSAFLDTQRRFYIVCVCVGGGHMTPHPLPVCSTHLGDA